MFLHREGQRNALATIITAYMHGIPRRYVVACKRECRNREDTCAVLLPKTTAQERRTCATPTIQKTPISQPIPQWSTQRSVLHDARTSAVHTVVWWSSSRCEGFRRQLLMSLQGREQRATYVHQYSSHDGRGGGGTHTYTHGLPQEQLPMRTAGGETARCPKLACSRRQQAR